MDGQCHEGIDYRGLKCPIALLRGDTFLNLSQLTMADGVTVASAELIVYDAEGNDLNLTDTIDVSGNDVTWGLLVEAETLALSADAEYSYRFRVVLSNSVTQTIQYGPLNLE